MINKINTDLANCIGGRGGRLLGMMVKLGLRLKI